MAISQKKSKRSPTGKRYIDFRKKKEYELGRKPALTKVAEQKKKTIRTMGHNLKFRMLGANIANVYDKKNKKYSKVKIKAVVESPASRHFVRRNIITKGAIIDTEAGKAKVTSRPGQDGMINAVLI